MITRRTFLLTSGVALTSASEAAVRLTSLLPPQPVVTYFDGQLWLDGSGASVAYRAPTRPPAVPVLTDEELYRARGYI